MPLWIFKCFKTERGKDAINEWYDSLPSAARTKFRTILQHLRDTPQAQWHPKIVYPIHGRRYKGLYEIRFQARNILYRPLGFFGPERRSFTLLLGAREQGNEFIPRNALEIAGERMNIVLREKGRADECGI